MKCIARVNSGRHYRQCLNNAKWRVGGFEYCGVHAKLSDYPANKYGRVPIKAEGAASK